MPPKQLDLLLESKIDKHRILFYRHKGSTLSVLDLFDTRQHPNKRPFA
jgi:hypothetical protein